MSQSNSPERSENDRSELSQPKTADMKNPRVKLVEPRLFWLPVEPAAEEDVEVIQHRDYRQLVDRAKCGAAGPCRMDASGGLRDEKARFSTFARSIPRGRPPPDPDGLSEAGLGARARWETDLFRYPPYT